MYYIYIYFYKARTLAVVSNCCLQNTEVELSIKIVIHKTKIEYGK